MFWGFFLLTDCVPPEKRLTETNARMSKFNTQLLDHSNSKPMLLAICGITDTETWDDGMKNELSTERPAVSQAELTFRAHSQSLMASLYCPSLM